MERAESGPVLAGAFQSRVLADHLDNIAPGPNILFNCLEIAVVFRHARCRLPALQVRDSGDGVLLGHDVVTCVNQLPIAFPTCWRFAPNANAVRSINSIETPASFFSARATRA